MSQPYATRPEGPLSLPIRMDRKRRRTKAGIAGVIAGVAFLSAAGYEFTITGSETIAIYLTLMGVGLFGVGMTTLIRAIKSR